MTGEDMTGKPGSDKVADSSQTATDKSGQSAGKVGKAGGRSSPRHFQRAIADERSSAQRFGWVRLARTVVLGSAALLAAIFWGAEQFGVQREVVFEFLTGSLLFVGVLAVAGVLTGLSIKLIKMLWSKLRNKSSGADDG